MAKHVGRCGMGRIWWVVVLLAVALAATGCGRKYVPTRPDSPRRPAPQQAPGTTTPSMGKAGPAPKGTFKPYTVGGKRYYPLSSSDGYVQRGVASWYGRDFHGKKTANGETYDMYAMTCAHKVLPMNTYLRITNENNGKVATVRVNDRGPFVGTRIVDLSYSAAKALDVVGPGTARVRLEAVGVAGERTRSVAQALADENYFVQVGAFTSRANADRMVEKMRAEGYAGSRVSRALVGGTTFWRVQAGAFKGMDHANRVHAVLKRKYPKSFLIAD